MKQPPLQDLRRAYMRAARLGDIAANPAMARKNFNELLGIATAAQIKETDKITRLSPDTLRAWRLREYARAALRARPPEKLPSQLPHQAGTKHLFGGRPARLRRRKVPYYPLRARLCARAETASGSAPNLSPDIGDHKH